MKHSIYKKKKCEILQNYENNFQRAKMLPAFFLSIFYISLWRRIREKNKALIFPIKKIINLCVADVLRK